MGVHDHGSIVWDEIVGYLITVFLMPFSLHRCLSLFKHTQNTHVSFCVCSPEQAVHTYASAGVYTVSISGHMSGFGFGQPDGDGWFQPSKKGPDSDKLVDILQWGCVKLGNRGGYFYCCKNLGALSARDVPDLTETTNLSCMFCGASVFTSDLSAWNVSQATRLFGSWARNASRTPSEI